MARAGLDLRHALLAPCASTASEYATKTSHFPYLRCTFSAWYSQCVPGTGTNPPPASTTTAGTGNPAPTGSGLNNKFKAKGKLYFGTEIDHYHLNNNPLINIVKSDFGQVTNENSLKWDAIERMHLFPQRRNEHVLIPEQQAATRSLSATPMPSSTSPRATASRSVATPFSGTPSCRPGCLLSATAPL